MSTCGHANVKGARFCATCGAALTAATATKAAPDEGLTVVLPGLDQSLGPAPPKTKPRERKQRKRGLLIATIIGLVVALAASTFAVVAVINRDDASAEVYLEAAKRPGANPFTKNVANQNPTLTNSYDAKGKTGTGVVLTVAGTEPGLYGGTQNNQSCDPQKLVKFLASEPAKAAAWAGVLGITPTQISKYVAGLTPAILRADTRVSNHGFANGTATVLQSVLQAGTAVLVDNHGIPRVRCSCGNPLTEPEPVQATYTGTPWPSFDEHHVVAITNGPPTDTFTLTDPTTGSTYTQPTGTSNDTGIVALGTDRGLQLLKDGKVINTALPGQRVFDLAESPDHNRLAFFSASAAGPTDSPFSSALSVLERDGTIITIATDLGRGVGSLTWINAKQLAYGHVDFETGDPSTPSIIDATPGAKAVAVSNIASYGLFTSSPGQHIAFGDAWYSAAGPHWIDFEHRTETPIADLEIPVCTPGRRCSPVQFSPSGSKVLAVTGQGIKLAQLGGTFALVVPEAQIATAFWLDDHRITYSTAATDGNLHTLHSVHVFNVDSHKDQLVENNEIGSGGALGPAGANVLVGNRTDGNYWYLELLNPTTGKRRELNFDGYPNPSIPSAEIAASNQGGAIVTATWDLSDIRYSYFVNAEAGTVTSLGPSEVMGQVLDAARSPASSIATATSPDGSRFYGSWHVHGGGATFRADGTGDSRYHDGFTDDGRWVNEVQTLTTRLSADGGSLIITVVESHYEADGVAIPNPSPQYPPSYAPGDTFSAVLEHPRLLNVSAINAKSQGASLGNPYLCGDGLAAEYQDLCGA